MKLEMKQINYWLSVVTLGVFLGFGISQVRAWNNPSTVPPGGNVSAPLTTGGATQTKTGYLHLSNGLFVKGGHVTVSPGYIYAWKNGDPNGGYIYADSVVVSPKYCLGSGSSVSCIEAWPSGGSGGITSISNGLCGTGEVVKSISTSGTVTCGTDATGSGVDNLGNHIATKDLNMQTGSVRYSITNMKDPVNAQDAATKAYVDGSVVDTKLKAGTSEWIAISSLGGAADTNWYGCDRVTVNGGLTGGVMTSCYVGAFSGGTSFCGVNIRDNKCQSNGCGALNIGTPAAPVWQTWKMKVTCIKSI